MNRTPVIRVAALAFVVLLVVAMFVGCAKFDGDKAEFCRLLPKAPSFQSLALKASSGSVSDASQSMKGAAAEFRSLEQSAPRSIRSEVAALGDSAERIARRLDDLKSNNPPSAVSEYHLSSVVPGVSAPDGRIGIFYDEFTAHPGTARAAAQLLSYAQNDCGLDNLDSSLGLYGYNTYPGGETGGGTGPFGGGQPQSSVYPGGTAPTVTLAPPVSTPSVPGASRPSVPAPTTIAPSGTGR